MRRQQGRPRADLLSLGLVLLLASFAITILGLAALGGQLPSTPPGEVSGPARATGGFAPAAEPLGRVSASSGGSSQPSGTSSETASPPLTGGLAASQTPPPEPVELVIPAIDVNADLAPLGLTEEGALAVPDAYDSVGYWSGGSRPGEPGPAVMVGHLDSKAGPAVFYRLRELEPGDEIRVTYGDGRSYSFAVERLEQAPRDAFPSQAVYGDTNRPVLRLLTCSGPFDRSERAYRDNLLVFASLVPSS